MASVAEAFVTVRPDMDRFGSDLRSGLGTLAKVAGAAALGIAAAIGGAAVKGVQAFANLERGMNEVFTLLPGITQDAMDEMTAEVRQFSREFGVLPDKVVPALYQALSAGVPQDNVFAFLAIATKASIGGVTELETAVDGITSVVNAYGEEVVDAQKASDIMFTAVRLGKTDFEQLSSSLFNVIPTAAGLGVEFEDVAAALAELTAQGVPTSVATTQLRQLFVELSKEGGAASDVFREMAGVTFQEFIAEGGNTADALRIMQEAAEENGVSLQDMFGSVEAGAAALALSQGDFEGFEASIAEMAGSAGATDAAFQQMDQGLSRTWESIKVKFNDLLLSLGERIAPALQRFADWFDLNFPAIEQWFFSLGEKVFEFGAVIAAWWTDTAKPALDEFVAAVQENWPTVESIFGSLGDVLTNLGSIFSQETSAWAGDTSDGSNSITEDTTNVIDSLNALAATAATVSGVVSGSWNLLAGSMKGSSSQILQGLDDVSGGGFGRFMDHAATMSARSMASIAMMASGAVASFGRLKDGAIQKGVELAAWMAGLPHRIKRSLGNVGSLLYTAGLDLIRGFTSGIRDMAGNAARAAMDAVGGAVTAAKRKLGISSPSKVFMEIGEQSGQGLIEGLEHMLRDVASAGDMLGAAAVSDRLTSPRPSFAVSGGPARTVNVSIPQYLDSRHIATSEVFIDTFTSEIRRRTVHAGGQTPW